MYAGFGGGDGLPSIILSEIRCPSCGKRRIRTPEVGGDYFETEEGYLCQEYCNGDCERNGVLCPPISGIDPDFISNRGKKAIASRIAGSYRLSFKEIREIAGSIETNNKHDFVVDLAKKVQLPVLEVRSFLW